MCFFLMIYLWNIATWIQEYLCRNFRRGGLLPIPSRSMAHLQRHWRAVPAGWRTCLSAGWCEAASTWGGCDQERMFVIWVMLWPSEGDGRVIQSQGGKFLEFATRMLWWHWLGRFMGYFFLLETVDRRASFPVSVVNVEPNCFLQGIQEYLCKGLCIVVRCLGNPFPW